MTSARRSSGRAICRRVNFDLSCPVAKDRDDEDEDWAEETTEEAQRRRMEEISDHAKNLTLSEDLEKPLEERVDLFYNFVKVSSVRLNTFTICGYLSRPGAELELPGPGPGVTRGRLFTELNPNVSCWFKRCVLQPSEPLR